MDSITLSKNSRLLFNGKPLLLEITTKIESFASNGSFLVFRCCLEQSLVDFFNRLDLQFNSRSVVNGGIVVAVSSPRLINLIQEADAHKRYFMKIEVSELYTSVGGCTFINKLIDIL
jgi:hypothetical protein